MAVKQVNWGIIGCGDVTEKKSGPAFNKIEKSLLVAVMRRNESLAADYAKRHEVSRWYSNASELINDPGVNAIYVATPPSSHAVYAIEAMKAGKPVYVEKPMAATYAECQEMMQVSEETGVPLFVAYYRRTLPGFLKVKELIEEGQIGRPLVTSIRLMRPPLSQEADAIAPAWRVDPKIAGGGVFYDLASHQLDFMDFLFGPVTQAEGTAENRAGLYAAEDTIVASLKFENGVIGSGIWSFVTGESSREDKMEIIGTEGKIVFSGFGHNPIVLEKESGKLEFPYLNPENIQYNLIKEVVEAIQYKRTCVSTGITASRTNWVMEQIVYG
ncbi:Gfo/Idh/MocA family protein [Alkalitalea saponilacus]|uniref:Predicted dehydrogenase n=1 Tax=Alkalitalea saponilacus TaxID=889453 RepID=A0A1T5DHL1_9BACT|nr:Gfo/Idh/MocA family oxidoreductase [Alkalitalea saponilacus]ASB50699.1 oxidoreductase [Alkalitalea saponilacus]SKB71179.1 Predicted dehydrogenase [Alkalitalea saponilacus]